MRVFNLFFILLLTTTILGQNKDIYILKDIYQILKSGFMEYHLMAIMIFNLINKVKKS